MASLLLLATLLTVVSALSACCFLEKDSGPCSQSITRYYYNQATGTCQLFLYSGCLGNCNRFISINKCMNDCT